MYLFFDTETTGLPKSCKAPVTDVDNWPRLVQIAWLFFGEKGDLIASGDFIVRPEGFIIPPESSAIHGISTERALEEGLPLRDVLQQFHEAILPAEFLVAHNINFDEKIVGAEFLRLGKDNYLDEKAKICTMEKLQTSVPLKENMGISGRSFRNFIKSYLEAIFLGRMMQQLTSDD